MTIYPLMLFVGLSFFALSVSPVAAQDANEVSSPVATKFDEFEAIGGCDLGARLDNLAIHLQNDPTSVGYIICYGPEGEGHGTGSSGLSMMMDYHVNTSGMDGERIRTINGGRYKEWLGVATELWIAPRDAPPPEPLRYDTKVEPFTGKFEEFEAWDNRPYNDADTGPVFRGTKRAGFAELLRLQKETRALIVAYNMKGSVPGSWRRAAKEIADDLQNGYKVEAERIEIIYGGYMARAEKKEEDDTEGTAVIQLWILPKDAPPPVAAAKEAEERPSEAVQIGAFSDYALEDAQAARRAFEGFADVLRSDEQLSACLIVRLKNKTTEEKGQQEATPQPADTPVEMAHQVKAPKGDLMALVEKWRADLVKEYGISEHRLVVMTGEASEWSDGDVETWLVPRGAALPDPNAEDEATEETEALTTDEDTQVEGMQ
jgi:hypothetical protein